MVNPDSGRGVFMGVEVNSALVKPCVTEKGQVSSRH